MMELNDQQQDEIHKMLVGKFWRTMIPNWESHAKNMKYHWDPSYKPEMAEAMKATSVLMNEAMAKWNLQDKPGIGLVFQDEDAYWWFVEHWK